MTREVDFRELKTILKMVDLRCSFHILRALSKDKEPVFFLFGQNNTITEKHATFESLSQ